MTTTEAAALLGISPATVRQAIARGAIKARRVGRDWAISRQECDRYASARRARPTTDTGRNDR